LRLRNVVVQTHLALAHEHSLSTLNALRRRMCMMQLRTGPD